MKPQPAEVIAKMFYDAVPAATALEPDRTIPAWTNDKPPWSQLPLAVQRSWVLAAETIIRDIQEGFSDDVRKPIAGLVEYAQALRGHLGAVLQVSGDVRVEPDRLRELLSEVASLAQAGLNLPASWELNRWGG